MRYIKMLVCVLAFAISSATLQAQEASTGNAAVAFEISGKTLAESELIKSIPIPKNDPTARVFLAKRIYGVISLPDSIEEVLQFQPGSPLPVDLIVIGEFDSKEDRSKMISDEQVEQLEKVKLNGKEYYVEPLQEDMHLLVQETRFEVGSKAFLTRPRQSLLTDTLKKSIAELGKAPLKIVIDLKQNPEFFESAVDFVKQQGVAGPLAPFLDLPKKIDLLQLSFDPNSDELLKLAAHSGKPEDAAFVAKAFKGLLGMAQLSLGQAPKGEPGVDLIKSIFANAQTSSNGNVAVLLIKKPPKFDEMVKVSIESARKQAEKMQAMNNLKQCLLAMHNYESAYRTLPFKHERPDQLSGELSWRVKVLPFIEQSELYQGFRLNEPWDSDHNKEFTDKCPTIFGAKDSANILWVESGVEKFEDIIDGMSYTIAMIESPNPVGWSQPKDITPEEVEKLVLGLPEGKSIIIGLYDGSVRPIDNKIDPQKLRAMLTPSGGEDIAP